MICHYVNQLILIGNYLFNIKVVKFYLSHMNLKIFRTETEFLEFKVKNEVRKNGGHHGL